MLRHKTSVVFLTVSVLLLTASMARAQQTLNFQFGVFVPRAEDARIAGDVLATNRQYLSFTIEDFRASTGGVEWLAVVGDKLEAGLGVGFYQRGVPSVYDGWVNADGSEIAQEMKLRVVPVVATVKFLPFGARGTFQPYVGVGLAVYVWRYTETGEFVDFGDNNSIYSANYVGSGTSVGPVATFGVRARISRMAAVGVEVRGQWGHGNLSNDFLSDKIDLGGVNVLGTLQIRF
ncbi:MAG: hypothetical protein NTV05_07705 [Acidobacteria bacterium]|nr:hypothetical protein [Acidobacteriota bacterium]